jgi:hypothetical protein
VLGLRRRFSPAWISAPSLARYRREPHAQRFVEYACAAIQLAGRK